MRLRECIQDICKRNSTLIILLVANLLLRISWLAYTGYFAEDAYITLRFAQNLAEGRGFVYNPGQPIYGTTSPMFTILMALWGLLWKNPVPGAFLLNVLASMGTIFFTYQALEKTRLSPSQRLFSLLLLISTPKLLFLDTQGMETPFVLLCIAASWFTYQHKRWALTGILLGLLLLVRIDTVVWVVIIAFLTLYKDRRAGRIVTGFTLAAYLPWLLFALMYFGTPIPQTITAKYWAYTNGGQASNVGIISPSFAILLTRLKQLWDVLEGSTSFKFLPRMRILEGLGTILFISLSTTGMILALRKRKLSLIIIFLLLEIIRLAVFRITFFSRYFITIIWAICLMSGYFLGSLWDSGKRNLISKSLRYVLPSMFLLVNMVQVINGAAFYRDVQRYRHNASLRSIGTWLNENMKEGTTVQLEPLGYIGYYSELIMMDEVGLVTPEVTNMKKQNITQTVKMLEILRPDIFVIHCDDADRISEGHTTIEVLDNGIYEFLIRFDPLNAVEMAQLPESTRALARASCYEVWGKIGLIAIDGVNKMADTWLENNAQEEFSSEIGSTTFTFRDECVQQGRLRGDKVRAHVETMLASMPSQKL